MEREKTPIMNHINIKEPILIDQIIFKYMSSNCQWSTLLG